MGFGKESKRIRIKNIDEVLVLHPFFDGFYDLVGIQPKKNAEHVRLGMEKESGGIPSKCMHVLNRNGRTPCFA